MRRGYSRPPGGRGYPGGGARNFEQHRGGFRGASRGGDGGHVGSGAGVHRGSSSYMRNTGPSGPGIATGVHEQRMAGGGIPPSDPRDRARIMGDMDRPQMGHDFGGHGRIEDRNIVGNYPARYNADPNAEFRERMGHAHGAGTAGRIGAGNYTSQYTEQRSDVGRFERDSYVEMGHNKERREHYPDIERSDRSFRQELKSPNESSPEYFSTNYPTTELEEEEYAMYQRRESEGGHRHERGRSPKHEQYHEDEFEYECENPESQTGRGPGQPQSDIDLSPDPGQRSNMSDIELSPKERNRNGGEGDDRGQRSSRDLKERKMDQIHTESRSKEEKDPQSDRSMPKRDSDHGFEGPGDVYAEMSTKVEDLRDLQPRSRSSSLPKDEPVPVFEKNATSVGSMLKKDDAKTSLVITVSNDQCPSKEEGSSSAIDRLGPPIPQMKDASERLGPPVSAPADRLGPPVPSALGAAATRLGPSVVAPAERLGPSVAAPQERLGPSLTAPTDRLWRPLQSSSADQQGAPPTATPVQSGLAAAPAKRSRRREKLPVDDDFDLYADIPPPEKEEEEIKPSEPKQDLVITFQPQPTDPVPITTTAPGMFPAAQVMSVSGVQPQPEATPNEERPQSGQNQEKPQLGVPEPGKDIPTVSVVTIPKSKWESDEESSEKHLILVPKNANQPVSKAEPVKVGKKRDPSLHMGQIVKDVRYKNPNPINLPSRPIGESKAEDESKVKTPSSDKRHNSEAHKKSKNKRRNRSRSRSRSRSRERGRRDRHGKDHRKRSRSDSRERSRRRSRSDSRDRGRIQSVPYRGRGSYRGRNSWRGRGSNRFIIRESRDRRRSRSRSRDRDRDGRRKRHDKRRTRSRSSSSSSYSSSSSRSSSGSSSRSSYSSRSRSRSKSPEKNKKKVDKKAKVPKQKVGEKSTQKEMKSVNPEENSKDQKKESKPTGKEAEKSYDIFSGEQVEKPKIKNKEETFAKAGGLPDPLGLKQLAKPMKSKVYSGPIYDMPPLTVTATTVPEPKQPAPLPLAAAKPLKSILKRKKLASEMPMEEATKSNAPETQGSAVASAQPIQTSSGPDLAQLSSMLATFVPQGGEQASQSLNSLLSAITAQQQQKKQEQEQQQLLQQQQQQQNLMQQQLQQQLLLQQQQQQQHLGFLQGATAIPGLGNEPELPLGGPGLFSLIGGLGGQHGSSIPGLDAGYNNLQGLGSGGIMTSSVTGLGGIPSAAMNTSIPGLGPAPENIQPQPSQQPQQQPNQNLASILQQSGLKMTPELSAVLGGMNQPNPTSAAFSAQQNFQSSGMPPSQNIPFLSGVQAATEEEDQFLYGEPQQASQYIDPNQYAGQAQQVPFQNQGQTFSCPGQVQASAPDEYIPEVKPVTTQAGSSVDSNHIQKILSAIGFDFDMAKKVQLEKTLGLQEKQPQQTGVEQPVQKSDYDQVSEYVSAQRIQAQQIQTQQATHKEVAAVASATSPEYKMEGLNQTASFLDTGLQVPPNTAVEEKPVKKLSKKKKKKAEKKKLKEEKAALKLKSSGDWDEKQAMIKGHPEKPGKIERGKFSGKEGSKSPLTEPISDGELDQGSTPKKHSMQFAELTNIKIQVAQAPSSSRSDSKRRIVLLPEDQGDSMVHEETRHVTREPADRKWTTHEKPYQGQGGGYYKQQEWEMEERKRIEEQLRKEAQYKDDKEKEKRRREMLKKEQEWLMREVALKTMEEKIRREEEKLLQVKELNKRQEEKLRREEEKLIHDWELMRRQESKRRDSERASEANRQYKLREERDKIQKKLALLEKALESLKKQQGDIMRRKQHTKDGHKDPQLLHNGKLQEDIADQIKSLRKAYATVGTKGYDKDAEKSSRESREEKERRSMSTERSSTSREDRDGEKGKSSSSSSASRSKRTSIERKEEKESKARFQFTYFDNGDHWCKVCQKALRNLNEFFIHLHSKKHMKLIDPMDRPWMSNESNSEKSEKSTEGLLPAPVKGAEFVMPVNGFYCRLCKVFIGDGICGTEHMKDPSHNLAYQKLLDENKLYEKQLDLEKAASSANAPIFTKEEDADGKGNKRKAEEGPEDKQSKQVKSEPADIKVSSKKSGGFGKFEFSKEQEPTAPAAETYGPAPPPPLELRKDAPQGSADTASKKDPKLTIKLGSSKRLIPSALLRNKNAQATPTTTAAGEASQATTTTDATSPATTTRSRSTRSSTLAQRPQPMIGKRPTRRPKEQPKESPPVEATPSSLDDFLQGIGGEALPVITDAKEVLEAAPKEKPEEDAEKKKETKEEKNEDKETVKDVVLKGDVPGAFKAEFGDPNEMEFIQIDEAIDEASDEELVEMPDIPGGEPDEVSSLPAPIPPPPAD